MGHKFITSMFVKRNRTCELILALDVDTKEAAAQLLKGVGSQLKWVKVGLQLFTRYGPDIVREVARYGFKVFLDLKLHDIPNTVASAVRSLKGLPIDMLTLHVSGGKEMVEAACRAAAEFEHPLELLGVTVLTSMDEGTLQSVGVNYKPLEQVLRLGELGVKGGLKGFVCSPQELKEMRKRLGPEVVLVTPGIREKGANLQDQKRAMTASEAVQNGASFIVVGRPISQAADPSVAMQNFLEELKG